MVKAIRVEKTGAPGVMKMKDVDLVKPGAGEARVRERDEQVRHFDVVGVTFAGRGHHHDPPRGVGLDDSAHRVDLRRRRDGAAVAGRRGSPARLDGVRTGATFAESGPGDLQPWSRWRLAHATARRGSRGLPVAGDRLGRHGMSASTAPAAERRR